MLVTPEQLSEILKEHDKWLKDSSQGKRADLRSADLRSANLSAANLRSADLRSANLSSANLRSANLSSADLSYANLSSANLSAANLRSADLRSANLSYANLSSANLRSANLSSADLSAANLSAANLSSANLRSANLRYADLSAANLSYANLSEIKGLVKLMGVEAGNCYWKRFDAGLNNNGFQFYVGLNKLKDGETFASDERVLCSYPGFHFGSRSWCAEYYEDSPLEAHIRIPKDAQINEPWATDGKSSADMIEILRVYDVATGKDVTKQYRRPKA
jgi:hypothetical protein